MYFQQQYHGSIQEFMYYCLHELDCENGLLIQVRKQYNLCFISEVYAIVYYLLCVLISLLCTSQVTTHSHLLSRNDITDMMENLEIQGTYFSLHSFDTELDFSNKVG